jgi:hypothetical protein
MYLYKLPTPNEYIFIKEKSLYNLYKPKQLDDLLLVPEKTYKKYEKHLGTIDAKEFRYSANELLKEHFKSIFSDNQLGVLQKAVLSFFINQFKISKEQYAEALQKILAEEHSFDLQVQLAKYELIKNKYPSSGFQKLLSKLGLS